ncbi:MAG TPA: hypothetical protein VE842_04450 [Pyrinomonadaceae bacterium]|jgi:hypothetical protein|nr:hypothetical protein [Pyrinomonadaceae bacterium]
MVVLALLLFIGSEALAQENVSRLEIGGQFSLLSRNRPTALFDPFSDIPLQENEPGFGGRVTCNFTKNIAFEAEGNFFPRLKEAGILFPVQSEDFGVPGGSIYQGQFGVKVGKRFKRVGIFSKVRPGFVGYTKVHQLIGVRTVTVFNAIREEFRIEEPVFRKGVEMYSSVDVGGVVEFYPSRRIVTRFDLGDTIIHYSVRQVPVGSVCSSIVPCRTEVARQPAETRHNLQFSAGVSIRF